MFHQFVLELWVQTCPAKQTPGHQLGRQLGKQKLMLMIICRKTSQKYLGNQHVAKHWAWFPKSTWQSLWAAISSLGPLSAWKSGPKCFANIIYEFWSRRKILFLKRSWTILAIRDHMKDEMWCDSFLCVLLLPYSIIFLTKISCVTMSNALKKYELGLNDPWFLPSSFPCLQALLPQGKITYSWNISGSYFCGHLLTQNDCEAESLQRTMKLNKGLRAEVRNVSGHLLNSLAVKHLKFFSFNIMNTWSIIYAVFFPLNLVQ